ncbi:MAG: M48 family metalloprotease [Deltaproteobacteria bacterium]|nr:M48 family metalloprotease [Deltaproteobacteria bacterium]
MSNVSAVEFTCGSCGAVNRLPREKVLHLVASPLCGKCDTPLFRAYDRYFDDLDPNSYIHPLDVETLDALKRIPGVSTLLRSLIRHSFELATRIHHHANFIAVGPDQLPSLWEQFEFAAKSLGIKQMPELYVYQDPVPQAYTFGVDKYFVAISTGCLELLDDDEVTCVLAHELGHVHADHVLYKSAARVFGQVAGTIVQATFGVGSLVVYPIQLALLRWDRASELSSDRAALIVMKNPHVVMRTLMKVAGGTRRLKDELSIEAFIKQADQFGKLQDEGPLGRYIAIFQTLFRSHPFPIWRAKEILDWVTTGNYLEILDGDYQVRALVAHKPCSSCGEDVKPDQMVCHACGHVLQEEPEVDPDTMNEGGMKDFTDPIANAWGDVKGWYKRNFNGEDDVDGHVVDVDSKSNKDKKEQKEKKEDDED